MRVRWGLALVGLLLAGTGEVHAQAPAGASPRTDGLSLLGKPSLPPDFKYFPYVNPDAPKGGEVVLGAVGSFDSFNPFIVRGTPATDVIRVWDSLMKPNADEAESEYGLLAQTVEVAPDGMSVAF